MDKVQKIREEVVRMHNLLPVMDGDNISINYADRICTTLEMYIDSMQEEPKECMYSKDNYTNADKLTLCKDCEELCIYNQKNAAESLGISQEEYEEIIDKCIFDDDPEIVDLGDMPFGARNSELEEAIYYIPEGYHAIIDGDKVIIKKL